MARLKGNEYYEGFIQGVAFSCDAAQMLYDTLKDFDPDKIEQNLTDIHEIEHNADTAKHELMNKLIREFIAPIEREDIFALCQNIDDVTDFIEDVFMHIYINNVKEIKQDAIDFVEIILECCKCLKDLMTEFPNFKRSSHLMTKIIEINNLEEQGDKLYIKAMRKLHLESTDPIEIIVWRELYDYFEKCADACEDVSELVESIVMKNT